MVPGRGGFSQGGGLRLAGVEGIVTLNSMIFIHFSFHAVLLVMGVGTN